MKRNGSIQDPVERDALKAFREAVAEAIRTRHRLGNPVAIGRGGKVYLWYPDGREKLLLPKAAGKTRRSRSRPHRKK